MKYISTRGQSPSVSFAEAVATGLAPDGGLYLPQEIPNLSGNLEAWESLNYADLCLAFMDYFTGDYDSETLRNIIHDAYASFSHPDIAPLKNLDDNLYVLELFHGPTLAFKDFALQMLGNLYEEQIKNTGENLNVLGATSGDTGAAAIYGLLDKPGTNIFILYPKGRISDLQERQMTCTGAKNVFPLAIEGSFDDAQNVMKEIFNDQEFRSSYNLSAVNSINLARILAQCVYYIYAFFRLPSEKRGNVEFVVPTGNFGNILSGWLAQKMGLPIKSLKIATNRNDILHHLFNTGVYSVSPVEFSHAPSMDIQVASNFERFIYYAEGGNPNRTLDIMTEFKSTGIYKFKEFNPDTFSSSHASDEEIENIIHRVHEQYDYIVDPHTACGFKAIDPEKTTVTLATAHPAKFPETIGKAIGIEPTIDSLEVLKEKNSIFYPIAAEKKAIQGFIEENAVS